MRPFVVDINHRGDLFESPRASYSILLKLVTTFVEMRKRTFLPNLHFKSIDTMIEKDKKRYWQYFAVCCDLCVQFCHFDLMRTLHRELSWFRSRKRRRASTLRSYFAQLTYLSNKETFLAHFRRINTEHVRESQSLYFLFPSRLQLLFAKTYIVVSGKAFARDFLRVDRNDLQKQEVTVVNSIESTIKTF